MVDEEDNKGESLDRLDQKTMQSRKRGVFHLKRITISSS